MTRRVVPEWELLAAEKYRRFRDRPIVVMPPIRNAADVTFDGLELRRKIREWNAGIDGSSVA